MKLPLLYLERLAGAVWTDFAGSSGSSPVLMGRQDWDFQKMTGAELRCRIILAGKLGVVVRGGYGWNLSSANGTFYAILGNVF